MLTSELRDIYLVDEMQLGQRLNESLQEQHHADFALMLAMLSNDVADAVLTKDDLKAKEPETDESLRKKFNLPSQVKKYATSDDFERSSDLSHILHSQGQRAIFLQNCMQNEPLVPFKQDLAPEVFSQLSPLKQEKIRRAFNGIETTYEPLKEKGDGFLVLDEIKEAKAISQIA